MSEVDNNIDCVDCKKCINYKNCYCCNNCENCYGARILNCRSNYINYNKKEYKIIGDFDIKSIVDDETIKKALENNLIVDFGEYVCDGKDKDENGNVNCINCIDCKDCYGCKNCYGLQKFKDVEKILFIQDHKKHILDKMYVYGELFRDENNIIDFTTATKESIEIAEEDDLLKLITIHSYEK